MGGWCEEVARVLRAALSHHVLLTDNGCYVNTELYIKTQSREVYHGLWERHSDLGLVMIETDKANRIGQKGSTSQLWVSIGVLEINRGWILVRRCHIKN